MVIAVEPRQVDSIVVVERARKDLGDLGDLVKSMSEQGLINPITIKTDGTLVAGERRLVAAQQLGWQEIACHIWAGGAETDELLKIEAEENTCRKQLTPTEAERAWQRYRKLYAERKKPGRPPEGNSATQEKESPGDQFSGKATKLAAKAVGYGSTTMERIETVREAMEDEAQPEEVREVAKQAYQELEAGTIGAHPASERVKAIRRVAEEKRRRIKELNPGATLRSDLPKAPPKRVDWESRLWEAVRTGVLLEKTADEFEAAQAQVNGFQLESMVKLLQDQIRPRDYLKKVLQRVLKSQGGPK